MIQELLLTETDYVYTFLRIIAGAIIFPYGMQKLLGWFDDFGGGVGLKESLAQFSEKGIPRILAWLVIFGQSLGSMALLLGLFGRIAAISNFIIFSGALLFHLKEGWAMNWNGKKSGEGIEYFIMLLSILLVIVVKGSGPFSMDNWLSSLWY